MTGKAFDPENIKQYHGKTFVTESGSYYGITPEGKYTGRPSIEGADIMLIAGVENKHYMSIGDCLFSDAPDAKDKLDDIIREHGQDIEPGLMLVVSLTPEYVEKTKRYGFITSPIKEIIE